jgi:hypothetical protein
MFVFLLFLFEGDARRVELQARYVCTAIDSVYMIHCPGSYLETFRRRNTRRQRPIAIGYSRAQLPPRVERDLKETAVSTAQQVNT